MRTDTDSPFPVCEADESGKGAGGLGQNAAIALGFRVMAGDDTAAVCAADVLTALLAEDGKGRLAEALEGKGEASEVTADFVTLRGPGVFALYAAAAPEKREAIRNRFLAELKRLQTEPVSPGELEYAKRRLLGTYLFDIETYAGQARMLGLYDVVSDYRFAMDYVDNIQKVTAKDLLAFAQRYFDPKHLAEIRE